MAQTGRKQLVVSRSKAALPLLCLPLVLAMCSACTCFRESKRPSVTAEAHRWQCVVALDGDIYSWRQPLICFTFTARQTRPHAIPMRPKARFEALLLEAGATSPSERTVFAAELGKTGRAEWGTVRVDLFGLRTRCNEYGSFVRKPGKYEIHIRGDIDGAYFIFPPIPIRVIRPVPCSRAVPWWCWCLYAFQ